MFVTISVDGTQQEIANLLLAVRNRQNEAKPKDWLVTDLDPDAREELNKNLAQLIAGKPMPNKGAKTMGITTERRLLRMIHKQAYIERECSSCLHNGDYTVCAFCGHDRQRFEWRFEDEFRIAQATAEDIFAKKAKGRCKI